jgi:hypothetical protein
MLSLCTSDNFVDVENEDSVEYCSNVQIEVFNMWFQSVIKNYPSSKVVVKNSLSQKEIIFIKSNNLENSIDCCYTLLQKHTFLTNDEQVYMILNALNYLSSMKIPKEYAGGFLILLCKYHFLP